MNWLKDLIDYLSRIFTWWIIVLPWERGLRIRLGKQVNLLNAGIHFKIPIIDAAYVQSIRLRVVSMAPQTVSTKDGKTLTIVPCVGYSISDIRKLYETLYQPEVTIANIVMAQIADYVTTQMSNTITATDIETSVNVKLGQFDYGIKFEYMKVIGYAFVRTYRLIQDAHWNPDSLNMTEQAK